MFWELLPRWGDLYLRTLFFVAFLGTIGCTDRSLKVGFLSALPPEVQLYTPQNPTNQSLSIPVSLRVPEGADTTVLGFENFEVENATIQGPLSCEGTLCSFSLRAAEVPEVEHVNVRLTLKAFSLPISSGSQTRSFEMGSKTLNIQVDTKPPTVTSFVVNNGVAYTNQRVLPYAVLGAGIGEVFLSESDPSCSSGAWFPITGFVELSEAQGEKQFYLKARDAVGNESPCTPADNIVALDTVAPSVTIASPGSLLGDEGTNFIWTVSLAPSEDAVVYDFSKVTLQGSDISGCELSFFSAGGSRSIKVFGCSGNGTVGLNINSGFIKDLAGNLPELGTLESVTVDNVVPFVTITSPAALTVVENQFADFIVSGTCNKEGVSLSFSWPLSDGTTVRCTSGLWTANVDFKDVLTYSVGLEVNLTDALGRISSVTRTFRLPDLKVFANTGAFAVIKPGGIVYAWGSSSTGGVGGQPLFLRGYTSIAATSSAFAALRFDGTVAPWGDNANGGSNNSGADLNQIVSVKGNNGAFAALRQDGTVVTWGSSTYGGTVPPIASATGQQLFSSGGAFAVIKNDTSAAAWGDPVWGGDGAGVAASLSSGVVSIVNSQRAFAALRIDGSVVAWGGADHLTGFNPDDATNVRQIYGGTQAFVAVKSDNSLYAWGGGSDQSYGGLLPSGVLDMPSPVGFRDIVATQGAFAALRSDGTVSAWGHISYGGSCPPELTLPGAGVVSLVANPYSFSALKEDGSVWSWGSVGCGSNCGSIAPPIVTNPADPNFKRVVKIFKNRYAKAALREDGSVITWGHGVYGGDAAAVGAQLSAGVKNIYATDTAFLAVKESNIVVAWGEASKGGNISGVVGDINP